MRSTTSSVDVAIGYAADVEQVDDSYTPGGPDDWRWPEGRIDQWGIGQRPSPRLKQVQRQVHFVPAAAGE